MQPKRAAVALAAALLSRTTLVLGAGGCCPNACSGHGSCNNNAATATFACSCYNNWQSGEVTTEDGDCGDRTCPFEVAWADAPDSTGDHHQYAECANKGICDRSTGECICFPGYEGKACGRMSCPQDKDGMDCSGNGRCLFANDVPYGANVGATYNSGTGVSALQLGTTNGNDAAVYTYYNWDNARTRVCLCDAGWEGVDCSLRSCPRGDDIMSSTNQDQIQIIRLKGTVAGTAFTVGSQIALTFTTLTGERLTTKAITVDTASIATAPAAIQTELLSLPGGVIDAVTVTGVAGGPLTTAPLVTTTDGTASGYTFFVTFTGSRVQGKQNLLEVEYLACTTGCTPAIVGLSTTTTEFNPASSWVTDTYYPTGGAAATVALTCGGRGKCNYDRGVCECFDGYTGLACGDQTALI